MIFLFVLSFIYYFFLNTPSPAKRDKSFQFGTKFKDGAERGCEALTSKEKPEWKHSSDAITNISV